MNFYLVTNPDTNTDLWLAWEDTAEVRIYAYSPNLGAFVQHNGLAEDFYRDMELTWKAVDADAAARIVAEGQVGKLDARTHQRAVLDWLQTVEHRKDPAELLGSSRVKPMEISPRRAATARAERVRAAAPGVWLTWKQYPVEHKQRAYVAAHDLRAGKIKALAGVPIAVRLAETDQGQVLVQVTRPA